MLTGLLVFVATLAFASAQCSLEGTTYNSLNTTIYFGAAVSDWIPAVQYFDDQGNRQAWFVTLRAATATRLEIVDHGSVGFYSACPDNVGQYRATFSEDCASVTFSVIYDDCEDRPEYWANGTSFALVVREESECSSRSGFLSETSESPVLSGEQFASYDAQGDLVVVSIGDYAAVFQEWKMNEDGLWWVTDLLSVPEGYACEERFVGRYNLESGPNCGAVLCGTSDSCAARAGLWHNARANEYSGDACPGDVEIIEWPNTGCSVGDSWTGLPYDCVNQFDGAQCMFCRGVANGLDVKLCLERKGGVCNDIFRSIPAQGWCNLEFECPASTLSLSVITVFSVLLALFFH